MFSNHKIKSNTQTNLKLITDANDIDQKASCDILVNSFIGEYSKGMKPQDIDEKLNSWRDGEHSVQRYYQRYFEAEFNKFKNKQIPFWVCAYNGNKLVGWATFEHHKNNAVYMDLLIVDPNEQRKGVGTQLVHSLLTLNVIPELTAIHLLLRRRNTGGRKFYVEKLGFYDDETFTRSDNYVNMELLTPLTWKNPALLLQDEQEQERPQVFRQRY